MDKKEWQKKGAGHRERIRDKFLERGIDALADWEVLELLLTLGTPRKDCKDIARAAIARFGSLSSVFEASQEELQKVKGIGPSNSFAIYLVHSAAGRFVKERLKTKDYFRSSREVSEYLVHSMRNLKQEVFNVIFLDAGYGIIDSKIIAYGTINTNTVYPRELIKEALRHHSAAVVVAHNHPSGNLTPSSEDQRLTRNLFRACSFMNIQLLDHFIIAGSGRTFSFADHGIIEEIRKEWLALM